MSDADDQMGGTKGETPVTQTRSGDPGRRSDDDPDDEVEDPVTEADEESFPASDPPANY